MYSLSPEHDASLLWPLCTLHAVQATVVAGGAQIGVAVWVPAFNCKILTLTSLCQLMFNEVWTNESRKLVLRDTKVLNFAGLLLNSEFYYVSR